MHSPVHQGQESGGRVASGVEELIQGYSNYLQALQKSPRTVLEYAKDVRAWAQWWNKPVAAFDTKGWDDWLYYETERGVTGLTIRRHQSSLRKFFKYLRRNKLASQDPAQDSESVGIVKRLPVWLTEAEIALMESKCKDARERAMFELLYACGLRNAELRGQVARNIMPDKMIVVGKGRKERVIDVMPRSYQVIKAYLDERGPYPLAIPGRQGRKLYERTVALFIKRLAQEAGVQKAVTPHTLRHSIATHLLTNGCNLEYIQGFLGHEDIGTTRIYTHIVNEQATKAILQAHPRSLKPSS